MTSPTTMAGYVYMYVFPEEAAPAKDAQFCRLLLRSGCIRTLMYLLLLLPISSLAHSQQYGIFRVK
jgi:hypothetical protein